MGWLRFVDSLKSLVSFAEEPYKRDDILQKRPIFLRSLLIVATPYPDLVACVYMNVSLCLCTCECGCMRMWVCYVTHVDVACYMYESNNGIKVSSLVCRITTSNSVCTRVYAYVSEGCICECFMSHMWMCVWCDRGWCLQKCLCVQVLACVCECVVSHIWKNHVTCMDDRAIYAQRVVCTCTCTRTNERALRAWHTHT